MNHGLACKLCGLPVKAVNHRTSDEQTELFCCHGCKMVYALIMESDQYRHVSDFKQTDIYKTCVATGVIPDATAVEHSPGEGKVPGPQRETIDRDDGRETGTGETLVWAFSVSNMWCPACAWVVEDALKKSKGVVSAACNFSSDRGKVQYDPVKTSPDAMGKLVESLGYGVRSLEESKKREVKEFVRLAITFFLNMNVMMFSWAIYSGFFWQLSRTSVQLLSWPLLLMSTVVLVYGGYPIHKKALAVFKTRTPGMEVLISSGSLTAYFYSVFNVFESSIHLYFDASSMLILLVLIGKRLEQSAKSKIATGLADFFSLAPEKVKLCSSQSARGRYVSIKQLSKGDIFQVEEGEILAADGVVLNGEAVIDESSITGEPKPLNAPMHTWVKSGTRVLSGSIRVKANQVGDDSVFGKMRAIMENSLSGKTRQTARFEGLLKLFVPVVLGLSLLTYLYGIISGLSSYEAVNRAISVMVISCPCALGVAIPLALVAGVSLAGRVGILVRDLEAFESIEQLNCVVFDKTGTLTTGNLTLLSVQATGNGNRDHIMQLAAALEVESNHYIALAIKTYCHDHGLKPLDVKEIQQHENGISGIYDDKRVRIGNKDFVGNDIRLLADVKSINDSVQVISRVYLSLNDEIAGVFTFGDSLRDGVQTLTSVLKKKGVSLYLVSGDTASPTKAVALSAGIERHNSYGGLLPHQKADFVKRIKRTKKKVVMVGDGINDAPAMAESDLAVAVHSGLNPGDSVASITLMQENPLQLLDFMSLATRVNRTVKQNLIFAFVYNVIGIPVAASGMLNPIVAVIAMLFSSLSVTFNTLFLVKKRGPAAD